ncbi:acyl-CoA thioesterase [Galbibacter sp. PAP.153]|uniref:acyl-CoA thioesterase n=1 Tax=Galbibacter sp. PAP.153 TaxID=3104623 RepID=UPI00300BABEB
MKRKMLFKQNKEISYTIKVRVRFVETDPLGIVWHGNYIQYFEDGREAFGRHHGISYLDQKRNGYTTPIVKSTSEHKRPLRYGDTATVKTIFVDSPAAKLIFRYEVFNEQNELVCTGSTVQVFVNDSGDLSLNMPEFFIEWKKKIGLINE